MEDRWLSVDEVAAYLGVKRDTIYKWIERNQMPAKKVVRLWKFKREDVDEWVNGGHSASHDTTEESLFAATSHKHAHGAHGDE
jgi:excisionase family DNA binding protein